MLCKQRISFILVCLLAITIFSSQVKPVRAQAGVWTHVELWWFNVEIPVWHSVENWTLTGYAFDRGIAWSGGLAFYLDTYGTYINFEDTVYFDAYQLNDGNVTFWNISMWLGTPISNFTVSTEGANIIFREIDAEHIIQFDVEHEGGASVWYGDFWNLSDTMPPTVRWEETTLPNGTYWMWNETNHLSTWYIAPLTNVLFAWNLTEVESWLLYPYTGSTPFTSALPIPLISIFGLVGLACMFVGPLYGISKFRKKEYRTGAIFALLIFVVGFALFVGWLWSGV